MYPNPAPSSNIRLRLTQVPVGKYSINIYNSFGRVVHSQKETMNSQSGNIILNNRQSIPDGLYRVEIIGPDGYRSTESILIRN